MVVARPASSKVFGLPASWTVTTGKYWPSSRYMKAHAAVVFAPSTQGVAPGFELTEKTPLDTVMRPPVMVSGVIPSLLFQSMLAENCDGLVIAGLASVKVAMARGWLPQGPPTVGAVVTAGPATGHSSVCQMAPPLGGMPGGGVVLTRTCPPGTASPDVEELAPRVP